MSKPYGEWTEEQKEKHRIRSRMWAKSHPEEHRKQNRLYYIANPKPYNIRNSIWRKNNPEKESNRKINYRLFHPEKIKLWHINNPEKRKSYSHRHRALVLGNGGTYTTQDILALLMVFNNRCPKCKQRPPNVKLTIDHAFPLKRGGTNWPSNLQILCTSCNSKKHLSAWRISPDGVITPLEVAFEVK